MNILRLPKGGLNTDDSVELLSPDDWSYAANLVAGRSYLAKNGEKENIRGATAIASAVDLTGCTHIGTIRSAEDDISFLFYAHATTDLIVKFSDGVVTLVLAWSGLNFSTAKDYRINGGGVVGDLLYFTDNNNQPRCVHLTRYAGGSVPLNSEEILHIKRGPIFSMEINEAAFVGGNEEPLDDVQFSYQYEYLDGQLSVIAPWTKLYRGYGMAGVTNALSEVSMRIAADEVIPTLVKRIKLIARRGNDGTPFYWMATESFEQLLYSYTYNQQSSYGGIVPSIYLKQFELVPLKAKASCITKSRAWFANYLEGYDLIDAGKGDRWTDSAVPVLTFAIEDTLITTEGPTFSPNSRYRLGVVFHDSQGRSSGVYSKDSWVFSLPTNIDDFDVNRFRLKYRIGDNTTTSGPYFQDWIKYYSLVITKDLTKTYYLQSGASMPAVDADGVYVSVDDNLVETYSKTYAATQQYLRVHMGRSNQKGIYYSFKEGDMVIVTNTTNNVTSSPLKVRSVTGPWIYTDVFDLGNTGAAFSYGFQVFTPNKVDNQLFYEIARREVSIGTTALGSNYSFLDGITDYFYDGDSILKILQGTGYRMAQMRYKPNQGNWDLDYGKPYIKTDIGQVQKKTFIRFSSPYIAGTNVNGLSEFNSGDEDNAPVEAVEIQKLQPTSRDTTGGQVILAICNSDSFSIYVDEARMSTNDGQSLVINSLNVIGDVRKQSSGFGTLHPESVFEEGGNVCWWDYYTRSYVRYSTNGIFPISEYKVSNYFEYQATVNSKTDIVVSGYDPFYKMIVVTFKNAETATKKTIGFCEPLNRWVSFYDFAPTGYIIGSKKMYSIQTNVLYSHDDVVNFNRFYGVDHNSKIKLSLNDSPDIGKEWKVFKMNLSNNFFAWAGADQTIADVVLRVDISNRHGQATSILFNEFEVDENAVYGEIRGDENTGGVLEGDQVYSNTIQAEITFSGGTYKQFLFAKAGFEPSRGHEI